MRLFKEFSTIVSGDKFQWRAFIPSALLFRVLKYSSTGKKDVVTSAFGFIESAKVI